jgi:hypothetical protein
VTADAHGARTLRERLAAAAPPDLTELLDQAALIHLGSRPQRADDLAAELALAVGELARADARGELDEYVERHGQHLRPLLLLELALEGRATRAMQRAADAAGFGAELEEWCARLDIEPGWSP